MKKFILAVAALSVFLIPELSDAQMMGGMGMGMGRGMGRAGGGGCGSGLMGGGHGMMWGGMSHMSGGLSHHRLGRVLYFSEELGLTTQQRSRIRDIIRKYEKDRVRKIADIKVAEYEVDQYTDEGRKQSEIDARIKKLYNLKAGLTSSIIKVEREILDTLTPEQRKVYEDLQYNWSNRWRRESRDVPSTD
ncbi:MAG: Spy/CpxP family protein refolding chaperone [Fidelibacterota bacterium]